jgi:hypothetical protein
MTEQPKHNQASDIVDDLQRHPWTPAEARLISGPLRLRADVPTVEIDDKATYTQDVLRSCLNPPVPEIVALAEANKGVVGVVVPVEQYLGLVSGTIKNTPKVDRRNLDYFCVEEVTDSPADAPAEPSR